MNHTDESTQQGVTSQETQSAPSAPRSSLPAFSAAPAFHSDDVEHVANYYAVSVLALISLLIGLMAPLYVLSKAFLLLPLGGIAISLLALRRISLSEGRLAGRWAASIGLTLCVASGAAGLTRDFAFRYGRTNQAKQFASSWLALVASNDLERAFKATYNGARPLAPPEPGVPPPEKTPYETFVSDPLIQQIVAAGKDADIRYVDTLGFAPQTRQDVFIRQEFAISPAVETAQADAVEPVQVYLSLQRSRFRGDRDSRWLVTRYEPADAPPKEFGR
jgi:hypothetical protein